MELKSEFEKLSATERMEFLSLINVFEDDQWDSQMKSDACNGRLDCLDQEIESAVKSGTLIEFPIKGMA